MRVSTYMCAVIAPVTTLVMVHSGCCYAEETRGTGVISRLNQVTGSKVFSNEWKISNYVNSQTNCPRERTSTGHDLMAPGGLRLWTGVQNRVVGGKTVSLEEYPFMATLQRDGIHLCNLCIISEWWLLTAGHCTIYPTQEIFLKPTDFSVIAGSSLLIFNMPKSCVKDEVRRDVDNLVWHPNFNVATMRMDLVLVHISRHLPFSNRIRPAPLPTRPLNTQKHLATGRQCQVPGWGFRNVSKFNPNSKTTDSALSMINETCMKNISMAMLKELQQVTLPVLSVKGCIDNYYTWAKKWLFEKEHICTEPADGQDPSIGDSGSPLVCNRIVVAMVSWGTPTADGSISENPTVFTRIDTHLDWIRTTTSLASLPQTVVKVVTVGQLAMAVASICHT